MAGTRAHAHTLRPGARALSPPPPAPLSPSQLEQVRAILDAQMSALQTIEREASDAQARAQQTRALLASVGR